MENKSLEKALEIAALLINGEEVSAKSKNVALYEEYCTSSQVYDYLRLILKKFNMELYEYNNGLFVSVGENNNIFGFSNEELRKAIGLRLNKELFMCYFIIYNTMMEFYKDSGSYTYVEFVRAEEIIRAVDVSLMKVLDKKSGFVMEEIEENSFKMLALLWEELPVVSVEDARGQRASKTSKTGYIKLTFNFLKEQGLFVENEDRYYPTEKFKALAENYYSENRGRLYEIMNL